MIKKTQNMALWLVLASIFSLQFGCSALTTAQPSVKNTKHAQKTEKKAKQKKAEKAGKSSKPKKVTQVKDKKTVAKATPEKSKAQLSSEVLYYILAAEIASQRGQIALAAALFSKAAVVTRDPRIAKQATRSAYYARDDKRAIASARLWYELEPNNIEARQVLAALLVRIGETSKATEHFEYVLTHSKHTEQQRFSLITSMLSKEQDKKSAMLVMSKLIKSRKDNPHALFAYSQLAFLVGELKDAAKTIKKVIQLESEWTKAYILQTNIFVRQGYKAHAIEVLRQTVEGQSDNTILRMFYARNLVDAKQYDAAFEQFEILTDDDKLQTEARYALGLLSLQINKPKQAAIYFSKLLKDKQRVAEAQYYLAQSLEFQNKFEQALVEYKKVESNQYAFEAKLRIAFILSRQGQLSMARSLLQNISPDSLDKELRVYITEGEILNKAKLYEDAFALYSEALEQLTDNNRLLYARALTAEKLGKIKFAITDLENVVQREPENAQALNALGYTLIDKTKQIKRGFEFILKASKIEPHDAAIHDSLGWAYYRLGQYNEALRYLRLAFEKLPDAEIAAHLGEVLWVAGERDTAQKIWDSALLKAPNDDLLLNVMQKFTE
ncbi:MAG: tetratricopeptide repeat protein [Woeseiaceae bacterium]